MYIDYIYLDTDERRRFAQVSHEYLIEQLQFTGFSVTRQQGLTDYIIPADAWGWDQKTAMEVVAELAAAQGAVVVPDRDTDELHIKHRYKLVGPWGYDDQPIEFVDARHAI